MPERRLAFAVWSVALWFGSAVELAAVAPAYTASSIVHAASGVSSVLVPNGLATLYGTNLSATTAVLNTSDVSNGALPVSLPSTGVRVTVNGLLAHLLYVSPTQVNFLVPSLVQPGLATVELTRTGLTGGAVRVLVAAAAPGMFVATVGVAVATRADGRLITEASPAAPGEVVVLYATGLGETAPRAEYGRVAAGAAWVSNRERFGVILDGRTLAGGVLYAGVTPGFAGLYQVNLQLPEWTGPNPEIRLVYGDAVSPVGVRLPVAAQGESAAAGTGAAAGASTQ
ncbi:MAG: hypothetical protein J0L64_03860 [Acidobacteria bacterium]|nr:hypothetical protein [Acidobacteriota bacterium]